MGPIINQGHHTRAYMPVASQTQHFPLELPLTHPPTHLRREVRAQGRHLRDREAVGTQPVEPAAGGRVVVHFGVLRWARVVEAVDACDFDCVGYGSHGCVCVGEREGDGLTRQGTHTSRQEARTDMRPASPGARGAVGHDAVHDGPVCDLEGREGGGVCVVYIQGGGGW